MIYNTPGTYMINRVYYVAVRRYNGAVHTHIYNIHSFMLLYNKIVILKITCIKNTNFENTIDMGDPYIF